MDNLLTIEIRESYKPENLKNLHIEYYSGGVFSGIIGTVTVNKTFGGVAKLFRTVDVYEPIVNIDNDNYIIGDQAGTYYEVNIDGLVKLVYEGKI